MSEDTLTTLELVIADRDRLLHEKNLANAREYRLRKDLEETQKSKAYWEKKAKAYYEKLREAGLSKPVEVQGGTKDASK